MTPRRIQLSRAKGWRKPANTIVVSRPSKHGNPFKVFCCYNHGPDRQGWGVLQAVELGSSGVVVAGFTADCLFNASRPARQKAVELFRSAIEDGRLRPDLTQLRGSNLACWCPLDEPCHADVLLELANAEPAA